MVNSLLMDFNIKEIIFNGTSKMDDNFNFDFKADFKFMESEINKKGELLKI